MKRKILGSIILLLFRFNCFAQSEKDIFFSIDCYQYLITKSNDLKFNLRLTNIGEKQIKIWDRHIAEPKNSGNMTEIYYEIISYPKGDTVTKSNQKIIIDYHFEDLKHDYIVLEKYKSEALTIHPTEDYFLINGGLHKIRFTYRIFLKDKNPIEVSTDWVYLYVDKSSKNWK